MDYVWISISSKGLCSCLCDIAPWMSRYHMSGSWFLPLHLHHPKPASSEWMGLPSFLVAQVRDLLFSCPIVSQWNSITFALRICVTCRHFSPPPLWLARLGPPFLPASQTISLLSSLWSILFSTEAIGVLWTHMSPPSLLTIHGSLFT
jgi:hypothetical protein